MESSSFITILLSIIGALWGLLLVVGGYCLKRISDKLDGLIVHRESCLTAFADRKRNSEDHAEFFRRTEEHERRLTKLECQKECDSKEA